MLHKALLLGGKVAINFVEVASCTFVVGVYSNVSGALGVGVNGGEITSQTNISVNGVEKIGASGMMRVYINKPYDDNLFSNGIAVECKGAYFKASSRFVVATDYTGYELSLYDGSDFEFTVGETVTMRFSSL